LFGSFAFLHGAEFQRVHRASQQSPRERPSRAPNRTEVGCRDVGAVPDAVRALRSLETIGWSSRSIRQRPGASVFGTRVT
jgi:hypothetical protein